MTKFMQAKFLISAKKLSQYPDYTLPESPLLGRSNVGKFLTTILSDLTDFF